MSAHAGTRDGQKELRALAEKATLNLFGGGKQGQHARKLCQKSRLFRVSFCLLIGLLPTDVSLLLKNVCHTKHLAECVYTWTGLVSDPALCGQKIFPVMVLVNTRLLTLLP